MLRRLIVLTLFCALLAAPLAAHADNAAPKNKGLYISPSRDFARIDPNKTIQKQITLANYTDRPLDITVSVQQFTVADYTYDYQFTDVHDDWIKLGSTQISLQPDKSQNISYSILAPSNAAPGGHYFSIMASAISKEADKTQIQAASILYVTVSGKLQTSSIIQDTSIPRLAFGDINFSLKVKGTGNTHFFIYVSGKVNGLAGESKSPQTTHILIPQAIRQIGDTIPAPLLPGVYTATVGYITDSGQSVLSVAHILYIPPWSLVVLAGLGWIIFVSYKRWRRHHSSKS